LGTYRQDEKNSLFVWGAFVLHRSHETIQLF